MELQGLSSNWKKLQQTLKADITKRSKRKASEISLEPAGNHFKYSKIDSHTTRSRRLSNEKPKEMGVRWSRVEDGRPSASLALWAEDHDIPARDIAAAYGTAPMTFLNPDETMKHEDKINGGLSPGGEAGRYIAIDCEMVGVGPTPDTDSALARVSIVNYHGHQLYDSFVQPKEAVTDYRTFVSGITSQLLLSARTFGAVQADVAKLLDGKILVGHAIKNDLKALLLSHPKRDIRDTGRHLVFRQLAGGKTPSLKKLAREVLGIDIQDGEHSSIEDARATMLLFRREKVSFDKEHVRKYGPDKRLSKAADVEERRGNCSKKKRSKKRQHRS